MIEPSDKDYGEWQQLQQQILAQTAVSIRASLKLEDILNTTVREVRNILQCDRVIIFQFTPDWHGTVVVESVAPEWTAILSTQIYDPCFNKNYIESFKQGLFTAKSDIYTAGINNCHLELLAKFQVRANLVIPILQGEEVWGLLIAHHCVAPREWQISEIELMQQLATQAGIAIQQADLFEQVQTELKERKQAEIALQQLNAELEQRVLERTAELTEVNEHLLVALLEKERTYQQLAQQTQLLELQAVITRNMAEGICLIRADNGVIVYANPKFEQMFGYDSGELNGQHVSIVNYGNEEIDPEEVNQAIRSAVLQRGEFSYEVHNIKKDGTPFWCSATCSVFNHSDYGDVLVAVHQDITVAKHLQEIRQDAEAALLQKSRKENLLWSITQGIRQSLDINVILNTTVTEVRQTLQTDRTAIYRFNPDWSGDFVVESVGENWVKLIGRDIKKVCEDVYLQETQGGRFRNHETFVIADIGGAGLHDCHIQLLQQFQAQAYIAVPIFSGELLWGLLIIYQNTAPRNWQSWEIELLEQIASQLSIAIQQSELYGQLQIELQERKQAEATIREAERRWRSLLDNVQLIVVRLDRSGNVNYINPFFLKLTGYTNAEVLGRNWFQNFVPRSHQQSLQTIFLEVLTNNAHPYYQNAILTKSGDPRFIAWNNTMLQDSLGNVIGTISLGEDITERQKIEQIKDEFIGIVSHELRTPLTGIQMSLGLIKTGVYDRKPEKARRMIEIALLDTNRLVNLVNDILDLERLDSGRAFLEKTVCKAEDLMQQAVDSIQAIAIQQQISLIISPTDVEVWVAADAIVQTLTNLLSNAIKFSPAQSTIHLSAENQTDFILFQVRDRGRGIPAEKLELIFGRFQQVDASDSREKGGTGLGLAICRSIIERHGGKIWAESILDAGSTFFFTLPLPLENFYNGQADSGRR